MPTDTVEEMTSIPSNDVEAKVGLYLVNAVAGNVGMPGAPILHLNLMVNAVTGTITGHAQQTQAVAPPQGQIPIVITGGHIRFTGFGKYAKIVVLTGHGMITLPPPAIGTYLVPFHAEFAIDNQWNGIGGWTLGSTHINEVPIHVVKS